MSVTTGAGRPIHVTVPQGKPGPPGPPGPPGVAGPWEALTQAEFNVLPIKDPNTLYVIVP